MPTIVPTALAEAGSARPPAAYRIHERDIGDGEARGGHEDVDWNELQGKSWAELLPRIGL